MLKSRYKESLELEHDFSVLHAYEVDQACRYRYETQYQVVTGTGKSRGYFQSHNDACLYVREHEPDQERYTWRIKPPRRLPAVKMLKEVNQMRYPAKCFMIVDQSNTLWAYGDTFGNPELRKITEYLLSCNDPSIFTIVFSIYMARTLLQKGVGNR